MTTHTNISEAQPRSPTDFKTRGATAIIVLGMHRSGTSALTRVLNLLGVDLGDSLMAAAAAGNETGFWEHQGVVDIHTALLNRLGMSWDDPRGLPRGYLDSDAAHEARAALIKKLREDFDGRSLWGVKDPRMCRFLPLWREVFNALGASPRYVLMLRHPLEVVRSLHQRDQMTHSQALLLWLRHSLEAEANSRAAARVFLRYSDLMQDWQPVAAQVSDALDTPLELTSRKAAAAIQTFIRPSMCHFSLDTSALAEDPRLMHWAGEVHQALDDAVNGDEGRLAEFLDHVSGELDQAGYYFDDTLAEAASREAWLTEDMHELHPRLNEREKWPAVCDRNLQEGENAVQGLLAQGDAVNSLQQQVQVMHRHVSEKDNQVLESQGEISQPHQIFRHIGGTWSWRLTRPIRSLASIGTGILRFLNMLTHEMVPTSFHQMRRTAPGYYRAETTTSHMVLSSRRGRHPQGWVRIDYEIRAKRRASPFLFFDDGEGFHEAARFRLPPTRAGIGSVVVRLPDTVTGLRLDPISFIGEFELGDVRITELNGLMLTAALVKTRVLATQSDDRGLLGLLGSLRSAFLRGGISELKHGLRHQATKPLRSYDNWRQTYADLSDGDAEAIERHIQAFQHKPLLSVIMPTFNTPSEILRSAVGSITSQLYPNWELCIADDASTSGETQAVLREYAGTDERIKITHRPVNGHISEASNSALDLAQGEFVVLVDHDDELTPHALYMLAAEINQHPDTDIIYSDEDKIDKDGKIDHPYFKPDFSPDMFLAQNFINHLGAYRRGMVEEVGRFRKGFEGSQDYDLALRIIEKSSPERIRHIPHVLYHWRSIEGSEASGKQEKSNAIDAAREAIREHLKRRGVKATVTAGIADFSHRVVYALPKTLPKVSLIVPTRDRIELLKMVVDGAQDNNDYPNWSMTIVDNGSEKDETAAYLAEITKDTRIKVLRDDGPFNFSRLNNRAVAVTDGEIIGLINNDIQPISKDWLSEMVRQVIQPGVGAVGAKLYYPNDTLQHGGVIVGLGGVAGHFDKRLPREKRGYFGRAVVVQNFSAVTAACMLLPRSVFEEVDGLDEVHLAVAFNDIDLCLKIRQAGYRLVWTPYAELYHHESVSRGLDNAPEKIDRYAAERRTMQERWHTEFKADPFYSPNLTLEHESPIISDTPRTTRPWEEYCDS